MPMSTTQRALRAFVATAVIAAAVLLVFLAAASAASNSNENNNDGDRVYATADLQRQLEQEQRVQEPGGGACYSPFGSLNGVANGVPAFSNCNDETIVPEDRVVDWDPVDKKVYYRGDDAAKPTDAAVLARLVPVTTGWTNQCVEYSRRYLLEKWGLVFQDCAAAVEIWRMTFLFPPTDRGTWRQRVQLQRFPNFASSESTDIPGKQQPMTPTERIPKPHDVIIWPLQKDMPYGHVGIVAEVLPSDHPRCKELGCGKMLPASHDASKAAAQEDRDTLVAIVRVGEQNYANKPWPGAKTYARELHLYREANSNKIGLRDPDGYKTLGWLRARPDLGLFTGAYTHVDDGEGVNPEGLPKRVSATPDQQPEITTPPEA